MFPNPKIKYDIFVFQEPLMKVLPMSTNKSLIPIAILTKNKPIFLKKWPKAIGIDEKKDERGIDYILQAPSGTPAAPDKTDAVAAPKIEETGKQERNCHQKEQLSGMEFF